MIVHVHADARVTLEEADLFTELSVRAPELAFDQVLAAFGPDASGDGGEGGGEHVWISIARLHALGAAHGGPDWRQGCDGMLEYAASKGWVDAERQRVRAHIAR